MVIIVCSTLAYGGVVAARLMVCLMGVLNGDCGMHLLGVSKMRDLST